MRLRAPSSRPDFGFLAGRPLFQPWTFIAIGEESVMEAIRARSLFALLVSLVWLAPLRAAGPLGAAGAGAQDREPGGGAGLGIPRSPTLPLDSEDAHWKTEIAASYSALDRLVLCSTVFQDHLILGGDFTTAGVRSVNGVASWDGREWSPLGGGMNGPVLALTVFDGKLYAGGAFTSAGGMPADHIACWDGTAWAPLGNGTDAAVRSFTVFDRRLIAGGEFHQAGGGPAEGIAVWDGEAWSPMGAGLDGRVFALAVYAGTVFAGGISSPTATPWPGTWRPGTAGPGRRR
jgi:hypothetical protein